MIHYTKFVKYHGQMVTLTRISLNDARFYFNIGYDIYIVQDLTEFDKKEELRLLFNANRNQGIKNFDDVVKLDLEYIDQWSLWLDCKLLLQTIGVVLFRRGSK